MLKYRPFLISSALFLIISGCSPSNYQNANQNMNQSNTNHSNSKMNQGNMNLDMGHSDSGAVPKGIKEAKNPAFKFGSQANIMADHMPGMKGAAATIDSAQQTTAYMIDYTPTTGGQPVKNHKWVIESELSAK